MNALTLASSQAVPASHGYADKYNAVLEYVVALEKDAARCRRLLERYVNETPLGHQPHMIELETRECLAAMKGGA